MADLRDVAIKIAERTAKIVYDDRCSYTFGEVSIETAILEGMATALDEARKQVRTDYSTASMFSDIIRRIDSLRESLTPEPQGKEKS